MVVKYKYLQAYNDIRSFLVHDQVSIVGGEITISYPTLLSAPNFECLDIFKAQLWGLQARCSIRSSRSAIGEKLLA